LPNTARVLARSFTTARARCDHARDHAFIVRRHDVRAGNAGNGCQLLDEVGANLPSLGGGIARIFQPLDDVVGYDRAVELLLDPARRASRTQRRHADQQRNAIGQPVFGKPRDVTAHDLDIHAELRLRKLRTGRDLALQALRHPVLRAGRSACRLRRRRNRPCR
jgi:hypothetical protein